ncbi:alpha-N-acetylgalactosaminide alpha-2,6-sialyltransferase 6 [Bos mutus]|uniref:alpha-N-acetylgalactosaminide alpha-2,6-sialyltransferase 6 n=1 Tax=Bos mutus TaxID=72004 RepID=UPI0006D93413|nr:PREDICTED: alpha-N-acetylgalactosaminide alpha-2,6-sialyltransferase 6-like [Bos mutus]
MSNNKQQRSAALLILFALITTLILCSPNSASEASHYSSLRGQIRQLVNLKKWGITDGYIPILTHKTLVLLVAEHRLVHHGDCSGVV